MKEKKAKSEKTSLEKKKKRKSLEKKQKKKELWALYDDLEPSREIGTQTTSQTDDLKVEVAQLRLENAKITKRFKQLRATAQREVKNLKKSRDEYRAKCETFEQSRRRHFETPKYLFDIFRHAPGVNLFFFIVGIKF